MTPDELGQRFRSAVARAGNVPLPGSGRTAARFARLWDLATDDLALARLMEAHLDAVAILHEAGRAAQPAARYGVWASESSSSRIHAEPTAGGWRLHGTKRFCSGSRHVTHALITASASEGSVLFELPVGDPACRVRWDIDTWQTEAFASTLTGTLHVDDAELPAAAALGTSGWYVDRPGFWHGAVGVAACWAGGAAAIVAAHDQLNLADAHRAAHAGAIRADAWDMSAALQRAADEIDADPTDAARSGRARALAVRFVVERAASDVLHRFGASAGPAPQVFDADLSRRCAELRLYLLQSHAERDLELLGRDPDRSLTAPPSEGEHR